MKFFLNSLLFLVILLLYEKNAFPISDYRIKNICRKEIRRAKCVEALKFKRLQLNQGKQIEIPVIPYEK